MQPLSGPLEFCNLYRVDTTRDSGMGPYSTGFVYYSNEADVPSKAERERNELSLQVVPAARDAKGKYYLLDRVKVLTPSYLEKRRALEEKIMKQREHLNQLQTKGFPKEEQKLRKLNEELQSLKDGCESSDISECKY